jgi:hypothetical protein
MATTKRGAQKWASYAAAQALAQEHSIHTPPQWVALAKRTQVTPPFPEDPEVAYGKQWTGWQDFLGMEGRVGRPEQYWSYAKARKFVQEKGFATKADFVAYARSAECPLELPVSPQYVYKDKGWVGFAEFLNVPVRGIAASKLYWPYEKAQAFVQAMGFSTTGQWNAWSRSNKRPKEMPLAPHLAYRGKGWTSWAAFLGENYQRAAQLTGLRRPMKLLSYTKARAYVAQLGLASAQDFRIWARSGARPENIPVLPDVTYAGKTWKGWSHFLGHEKAHRGVGLHSGRNVLSYSAAQALVKSLELKTPDDYMEMLKAGKLPNGLPAQPNEHYSDSGWTSWGAFLGSRSRGVNQVTTKLKVREDGFLKFPDARKFVRALAFPNTAAWFKYAASPRRPVYIPKEPWKTYFQEGYSSLEDFIGVPVAAGVLPA